MKNSLIKYGHDSRCFCGYIYEADFCTDHPPKHKVNEGSKIAQRIESNWKFDRECNKYAKNREFKKVVDNA